jgi:hypothetical protein
VAAMLALPCDQAHREIGQNGYRGRYGHGVIRSFGH